MGNCWSKLFQADPEDEDPVDPNTPLLGHTIKSLATSDEAPRSPRKYNEPSELRESTASLSPSQRPFPNAPTGRLPPRQPSQTSLLTFPQPQAQNSPPPNPPSPQGQQHHRPKTQPPPLIDNPPHPPSLSYQSLPFFPRSPSIPPEPSTEALSYPLVVDKQDVLDVTSHRPVVEHKEGEKQVESAPADKEMDKPGQTEATFKVVTQGDVIKHNVLPADEKERPKDVQPAKPEVKEVDSGGKGKPVEREKIKHAPSLSKILTSKSDVTPQERVSQTIQNLLELEVCRDLGEIVQSDSSTDLSMSVETTMKHRADILTLKASKNTVELCEVVDTLTQAEGAKNTMGGAKGRRGRWEEELREKTRKAAHNIENLVIECRNANVDQRKANVKVYIENIEKLLEKINLGAAQLVELVLGQWEVTQCAQSIIDASNRHQAVNGIATVLKAAKVAVSVVQRLIDSLANELVTSEGTPDLIKMVSHLWSTAPANDRKEMDPALFFSNALNVCSVQLFDAVDAIAQNHFDPGTQLELWNKAKAVRGSGILLQLSITEKDRGLSDRCLSLSAASRVFSSSVVGLIDSSASALAMTLPNREDSLKSFARGPETMTVWEDAESNINDIILLEQDLTSSAPLAGSTLPERKKEVSSRQLGEVIPTKQEPAKQSEEVGRAKLEQPRGEAPIPQDSSASEIQKVVLPTEGEIAISGAREDSEGEAIAQQDNTTEITSQADALAEQSENPKPQGESTDEATYTTAATTSGDISTVVESPTTAPRQDQAHSSLVKSEVSAEKPLSSSKSEAVFPIETAGKRLKAATLNGLLLYLISDKIDIQYMETIALTYRSFTDSRPFFFKLVELYNVPDVKGSQIIVIQSRVVTFAKMWISLQVQDFSQDLIKAITKWTEESLSKDNHAKGVAKKISEILATRDTEFTAVRKSLADSITVKIKEVVAPTQYVLDMDPHEIAFQLTHIDHALFCSIRPHELLFQSWNKPHLRHRSPNVLSMISRTNNIALWVASSILWHPKVADRVQVMTKLIFVAEHLRKLKNFNTMFAVLSGLQLSSINRLKYTKERIPKKQIQTFESLVELMSTTKSFKAYREALAAEIPPCIPYLGLCLTDLTFIEEGNPDFLPNEGGPKLINFKKREKLFKVISFIQQYQNWKYPALHGDKTSILEELPRNEEEQLYGMSLLREPRNASKEHIA